MQFSTKALASLLIFVQIVIASAITHGVKFSADAKQSLWIALFLGLFHSLALFLSLNRITMYLLVFGIVCFSGGIYLKELARISSLSWIIPIGGGMWILGWLLNFFMELKRK